MDPKLVMAKWKTDFEALYLRCNSPDNSVDNDFLEHLEWQRAEWVEQFQAATVGQSPPRSDLEEDIYLASPQLNASITLQETINALKQCNNGKATGIDNIPNEILKVRALQQTLHKLFRTCFDTGKIPSMWYKEIIHLILKTGKDSLLPLSHRGSLMSTVAKIFSATINNRLTAFMESHGIYAEEQNGFRRLRSCLDHLYTLTIIIRNRKAHNQETFLRFYWLWKSLRQYSLPTTMVQVGSLWNTREDSTNDTIHVQQLGMLHPSEWKTNGLVQPNGRSATRWHLSAHPIRNIHKRSCPRNQQLKMWNTNLWWQYG